MNIDKATKDQFPVSQRRKLPDTRPSTTCKFTHCGWKGYLTVGFYPDTEQPGEIFIIIAKEGTFISATLDMLARQCSFLLQRGVPAGLIIEGWRHHVIDPVGPVQEFNTNRVYNGSLFDTLAEAFTRACAHYGDCDPDKDHLRRSIHPQKETLRDGSDECTTT